MGFWIYCLHPASKVQLKDWCLKLAIQKQNKPLGRAKLGLMKWILKKHWNSCKCCCTYKGLKISLEFIRYDLITFIEPFDVLNKWFVWLIEQNKWMCEESSGLQIIRNALDLNFYYKNFVSK